MKCPLQTPPSSDMFGIDEGAETRALHQAVHLLLTWLITHAASVPPIMPDGTPEPHDGHSSEVN